MDYNSDEEDFEEDEFSVNTSVEPNLALLRQDIPGFGRLHPEILPHLYEFCDQLNEVLCDDAHDTYSVTDFKTLLRRDYSSNGSIYQHVANDPFSFSLDYDQLTSETLTRLIDAFTLEETLQESIPQVSLSAPAVRL